MDLHDVNSMDLLYWMLFGHSPDCPWLPDMEPVPLKEWRPCLRLVD